MMNIAVGTPIIMVITAAESFRKSFQTLNRDAVFRALTIVANKGLVFGMILSIMNAFIGVDVGCAPYGASELCGDSDCGRNRGYGRCLAL